MSIWRALLEISVAAIIRLLRSRDPKMWVQEETFFDILKLFSLPCCIIVYHIWSEESMNITHCILILWYHDDLKQAFFAENKLSLEVSWFHWRCFVKYLFQRISGNSQGSILTTWLSMTNCHLKHRRNSSKKLIFIKVFF